MKIALVHDYLAQDGGAERVLQAFHEVWPDAPIFVLFYDEKKVPYFQRAEVRESLISKLPFGRKKFQWYLPLMPFATERHDLSDFDVVLSSTSAFAKGVMTKPDTLHISYCHTPTRYLWSDTKDYIADLKYNRLVKALLPPLIYKMRLWDKMSVDRVDQFIANSDTVRKRIGKYYRRDADIIYPPVDLHNFSVADEVKDYFVTGGRLVPYKRFDLVVQAFNRLKLPLIIFGEGPERARLEKLAKENITFVGRVSDEKKSELMRHAKAFIHPQVEDFGITPVESMASGRPVIAYAVGGVTETVIPGKTGVFFADQTWESLFDAVLHFDEHTWDSSHIRAHASKYDVMKFKETMKKYVEDVYEKFHKKHHGACRLDVR